MEYFCWWEDSLYWVCLSVLSIQCVCEKKACSSWALTVYKRVKPAISYCTSRVGDWQGTTSQWSKLKQLKLMYPFRFLAFCIRTVGFHSLNTTFLNKHMTCTFKCEIYSTISIHIYHVPNRNHTIMTQIHFTLHTVCLIYHFILSANI